MSQDITLFILMHSRQDWQKLLGAGGDVEKFLDWLWQQNADAIEDASAWVRLKIEEFKTL
jgi:hypothetical protein